jgi:lysophospholipase L1-like esterase
MAKVNIPILTSSARDAQSWSNGDKIINSTLGNVEQTLILGTWLNVGTVNLKQYKPKGNLFNIDFTTLGNLSAFTSSAPDGTISLSSASGSQYLRLVNTSGNGGFLNYIKYNAFGGITSRFWDLEIVFIPRAINGTNFGIGVGLTSSNPLTTEEYKIVGRTDTSKLNTYIGNTQKSVSSESVTLNANNRYKLKITRSGNTLTSRFRNLDNYQDTYPRIVEYLTRDSNLTGYVAKELPVCVPYIYCMGGTFDVAYMDFTTRLEQEGTVVIGDDISQGFYITNDDLSYPDLLQQLTNEKVLNFASQTSRTSDWLNCINQVVQMNPSKVIIMLGRNDLSGAVSQATILANIATIVATLDGAGINYIILSVLPDSTVGASPINNLNTALLAAYPTKYLDVNTALNNGSGSLKTQFNAGDNIHLSSQAHYEIAKTIVSGSTISTPFTTIKVATITSNTTLLSNTSYLTNATSGNLTLTLPSAAGKTGELIFVKKTDSTVNTVTIATTGSQTIDGDPTLIIQYQNTAIPFQSNGTNWFIPF